MGKPTGFLEYERETAKVLPPKVRIANFKEFRTPLNKEKQKLQGARCMACGVPFCQSGMMIGGMASGCPLHNLVPETNDLVYTGNWKQAFLRLSKTHSFPEFTSRVCPALCEAACTCNLNGEPISTKENERAIIETAYENGWVTPQIPEVRTGKSIAVIGSGPSGLAAAQQLNRRGHSVTVFERKDRVGGLLRYGIPNMKLDKAVVDRRIHLMEEEGVKFVTNVNVGKDIKAEELLKHAEDYVPEDVQNLMEVLDAAKAVAADPAATQETVDAAQNALDAAMNIAPIQKEFAIMAAAGEGGSITPCGTVKVERGMSQTFVIQPEEGYVISDVLVNGQSVGAVAEYTFCDVNADANITALFQKAAVSTDKSQLTAVIKEAEERLEQADKYTEETVKALQKEVEAAQFILADKEASQADIDTAVQKVRTAIDALEEKTQTEKPENPDNNKPDNNKPGNGNNGGQNNNGNSNQSTTQKPSTGTPNKAVKTGDATPIAGAVSGLLAGGAALLAFLKRRK